MDTDKGGGLVEGRKWGEMGDICNSVNNKTKKISSAFKTDKNDSHCSSHLSLGEKGQEEPKVPIK